MMLIPIDSPEKLNPGKLAFLMFYDPPPEICIILSYKRKTYSPFFSVTLLTKRGLEIHSSEYLSEML